MGEPFKTILGEINFLSDNLIYIKIKDKLNITVKDGVIFRDQLLTFSDKKFGILVDARDIKSTATINSMRFFTIDPAFNKSCVFQSIVTDNLSIRLLANFYVKYLRNKSKAKVFNNYNDALLWLEDQVETLKDLS
tara:strand:- start:1102 stop:1506 length:405 start_codon:yes stop_codon:yes gene_type:complete